MAVIRSGDNTVSIVLVLDLHAGEAADIDVGAEVAAGSCSLGHAHIQVEGLVSLVLAVGEAGSLLGGLGKTEISLDTVLLALAEEELGKRVGHEALLLILRVVCPIRHFSIFIKYYNILELTQ